MKKKITPLISLWIMITVAMAIFIGLSLSEDITLGGHTISKAKFKEVLLPEPDTIFFPGEEFLTDTLSGITEVLVAEPDTTVHNVLIFGDSMTHNLAMSISKYGTKNNYKVTGVTWESSSIAGWSKSDKIRRYLKEVNPDYVFISLGANELELKNFDRRIPEVRNILAQLDTIPYVWVGPPLWKEDKGLYAMLEKVVPKDVLFKVENIDIPRGPDKIHPTRRGADIWADTLMRWIAASRHPILAEIPDSGTSTRGHKFIYLHPND